MRTRHAFLMDLKQKFQNKYQLYDIEQLKSRDLDHQQAKKLMTV
jgi:chromosome condensin MukBEF MukE localization factor